MDRERVEITRPIVGICVMQVCAVADATDEEILGVCNRLNPAGTEHGWTRVIREGAEHGAMLPVVCSNSPNRKHFLVTC